MFIQLMRGKVKDAAAARAGLDAWQKEMKPKAVGYLGSTSGVTDDGTFVAVARFESEEAARANSESPEQNAWYEKHMSTLFDGAPTFVDCPNVDTIMGGGSDTAGFVQVMVYTTKDVAGVRALSKEFEKITPMRPDILGGTSASNADGAFVDTTYFTSEKAARDGETGEMPADVQALFQRFGELAGAIEYLDIRDPWFDSA